MSRQIQIRRGDAVANDNFIGAIGEVTMDTTNNTLRVHDGETLGGTVLAKQSEIPEPYMLPDNYDFVTEWQNPTAENGYTWYRKYKSGWIEQGGKSSSLNVVFPVQMLNTNYLWFINSLYDNSSNTTYNELGVLKTKNVTGFTKSGNAQEFTWVVYGLCVK